jgi:serine/threonine protein phosphatase PrpC
VPSRSPVFGRPSPAAEGAPALRSHASAAGAAIRADGGDGTWLAIRAVSLAGIRHRLAGQASEDSFAWAQTADAWAVAVADGLGSIEGSAGAADRAVRAAVADAGGGVGAAIRAARTAAEGGGATTLVFAVIRPDGGVELGRIGDSTAYLVSADGRRWQELFVPGGDDAAVRTATDALPGDAEPELAAASLDAGAVLVLATDGVADPWRDGPTTVAPALAEAVVGRPSLLELANLADFSRQGCHDDRSLVAVWMTARD